MSDGPGVPVTEFILIIFICFSARSAGRPLLNFIITLSEHDNYIHNFPSIFNHTKWETRGCAYVIHITTAGGWCLVAGGCGWSRFDTAYLVVELPLVVEWTVSHSLKVTIPCFG